MNGIETFITKIPMIKPYSNNLLVEEIKEEKTASGVIIPDTNKEGAQRMKVIEVGEGKRVDGKREPMKSKKGDVVYCITPAFTKVNFEGKEYSFVSEDNILGKEL